MDATTIKAKGNHRKTLEIEYILGAQMMVS
jgi:hypothetical protein